MLVGPFRGRTPAPFHLRGARGAGAISSPIDRASEVPSSGLGAREVRIVERIQETADAITLVVVDPAGADLAFVPGAFFTVIVAIDGAEHRRAYSASGPAQEPGRLRLTVRRVDGGRVSGFLHDRVAVGDTLRLLGPSGAFTLRPAEALGRRLVMIAGGSGITPIMAMIRSALAAAGPDTALDLALVYGNRRRDTILFAEALAELAAAHPSRLRVQHVLEDMSDAPAGAIAGRLDEAGLAAALTALGRDPAACDGLYVCGPEPMLEAARAHLDRLGVPAERRHEERFTGPQRRSGERADAGAPVTVTIRRGGRERPLVVPAGRTILEAAQAADLGDALPFSCAMGGCGACKVRVIAGEVAMDEPNCLTREERAAGHALTCVGAPLGPCTLEVPEATA